MFEIPGMGQLGGQISKGLEQLREKLEPLVCVAKAAKCLVRYAQLEYGVLEDEDSLRCQPRQANRPPLVLEASAPGVTVETTLLVEQQLGYVASRGYYANLGADEFQVILESMSGAVSIAHTVPAGSTIAITCLVSKVTIQPVGGRPARYQVLVQ